MLRETARVEARRLELAAHRIAAARAVVALEARRVVRDRDAIAGSERGVRVRLFDDAGHLVAEDLARRGGSVRELGDVGAAEPAHLDAHEDLAGCAPRKRRLLDSDRRGGVIAGGSHENHLSVRSVIGRAHDNAPAPPCRLDSRRSPRPRRARGRRRAAEPPGRRRVPGSVDPGRTRSIHCDVDGPSRDQPARIRGRAHRRERHRNHSARRRTRVRDHLRRGGVRGGGAPRDRGERARPRPGLRVPPRAPAVSRVPRVAVPPRVRRARVGRPAAVVSREPALDPGRRRADRAPDRRSRRGSLRGASLGRLARAHR